MQRLANSEKPSSPQILGFTEHLGQGLTKTDWDVVPGGEMAASRGGGLLGGGGHGANLPVQAGGHCEGARHYQRTQSLRPDSPRAWAL
eukprot:380914-Prorocentrum_minimum.AAC.6